MITIKDLSMHYTLNNATITVLQAITVSVAQGERIAVIGPSGSGKTTLLLLLAGLEQPSEGTIVLNDVALQQLDRDQLADLRRDRIGIVFQSFHLIPSLNALENVALALEIAGRRDARSQASQMLERVGLTTRLRHYPAQLSGGEQQRVALARALVHNPQLVLADEPTGNLDDHTGAEITELLFNLNRETDSTLVLVTHDRTLAERCDRILHLHEGRLTEQTSHHQRPTQVAAYA